ncbi:universal stress protein [Variovorax sp. J31P207]|uniref:universal stress protein n=1 Tax=Variovorax sp. J31P207 TaxID=3053510 RepID=UPI00257568EE|nr:universal stress protein [Variovorax sp. J31P207]MDM0072254.1 universal stress protein [Variovorax sp. J31P207]
MYQRILVPLDGSATSKQGLDEAIRLAAQTHGRLRLVHVVDSQSMAMAMGLAAGPVGDCFEVLARNGRQILDDGQAAAAAAGVEAETLLHDGASNPVPDLIAADASRWPADLIVIGTHGRRGVERFVGGSCAEYLLRCTPVPVLLVQAPADGDAHAHRHAH